MSLKVIGAGYGRTGTASLKLALESLGFGPCHHMSEVLPNPERVERWARIGNGATEWDDAFAGYNATVDWPSCTHYKALADHYPDAKVILSLRDPGKWFESVYTTILAPEVTRFLRNSPMGEMLHNNIYRLFDGSMHERQPMIDAFNRHNEEVQRTIPAERLLVFEAKDGWGPLCKFLGVAVPDGPYPHVNTKEETAKLFEHMMSAAPVDHQAEMKDFADRLYTTKPETPA